MEGQGRDSREALVLLVQPLVLFQVSRQVRRVHLPRPPSPMKQE